MTDQIPYQRPTDATYRSIRYSIHRNVRGLSVAKATQAAEEDLKRWREEQHQQLALEAQGGAA